MSHQERATYGVVVEDKGVLIFVEVVQRALWDAVLDLDRTLDVLLVRQLHLVVDCLCVVPLARRKAHHALLVIFANFKCILLVACSGGLRARLLLERKRFVVLATHVELSVASLHESGLVVARVGISIVLKHQRSIL